MYRHLDEIIADFAAAGEPNDDWRNFIISEEQLLIEKFYFILLSDSSFM